MSDSFLTPWTVACRLLCPWNSSGKSTGMGYHFLLQGIFPTQGSNLGLLHCRQILNHLSHQGSPSSESWGAIQICPPLLFSEGCGTRSSWLWHMYLLCLEKWCLWQDIQAEEILGWPGEGESPPERRSSLCKDPEQRGITGSSSEWVRGREHKKHLEKWMGVGKKNDRVL